MLLHNLPILNFLFICVCILICRPQLVNSRYVSRGSSSQKGLCRFGNSIGCCYGWKRNQAFRCEPVCKEPCEHGSCTGPNKCTCDAGYTGKTCSDDYNECRDNVCQHRCMNTDGSYRCYCRHGHVLSADGRTCYRDNRCRADRCHYGCIEDDNGFHCNCPEGLKLADNKRTCVDIDECATIPNVCPRRRRCQNTFGSYLCMCDVGYSFQYVSGRLRCRDEDECETGNNGCSSDATCINTPGSYNCYCHDGFFGDGKTCYEIDPRRCEENPCSPLVSCKDVDFQFNNVDGAINNGVVKLFECGPCPDGYTGNGETCTKSSEEIVVLVVDKADPEIPLEGVNVQVLDGLETLSVGITGIDGFVKLAAPFDSLIIIAASKSGYFDSTMTYSAHDGQKNVLRMYLTSPSDDLTREFIYDDTVPKTLDFTLNGQKYEFILPQGGLDLGVGQPVKASFISVDIANDLRGVPEFISLARATSNDAFLPGLKKRSLQTYAVAALRMENVITQAPVALNSPMTIKLPLPTTTSLDSEISAWFYNSAEGVYLSDGQGEISSGSGNSKVWSHQTNRLTWIAAAKLWPNTHCVEVRVCRDENCAQTVPNAAVWLSGIDFHYSTFRRTDSEGKTCFNFQAGGQIGLGSCFGSNQITVTGSGEPSSCDEEGQWQELDSTGQGICQVVTILHSQSDIVQCGDPGTPSDAMKLGNVYSFGANVTFTCNPGYDIVGSSQRICHSCGEWSGFQPACIPREGSGDALEFNFLQ